jgi:hypothetical protein
MGCRTEKVRQPILPAGSDRLDEELRDDQRQQQHDAHLDHEVECGVDVEIDRPGHPGSLEHEYGGVEAEHHQHAGPDVGQLVQVLDVRHEALVRGVVENHTEAEDCDSRGENPDHRTLEPAAEVE